MGIGDSGTTGSHACLNAKVVDIKPAGNLSIKVSLANGTHVHSTHIGYLPQQHLPLQARLVHLFPNLNKVLLSLGQFCDAGMKIILTKKKLLAVMDDESNDVILEGTRETSDGMWYIDLETGGKPANPITNTTKNKIKRRKRVNFKVPIKTHINHVIPKHNIKPTIRHANSVYELERKKDIAEFLSAAMWNPVPETWTKAIDSGFFATWPGLTSKLIRKHLSKRLETSMGHMRADRKNVRSTKPKLVDMTIDACSNSAIPPIRANEFYTKVITLSGKVYSDQTGRFPVTSSKGNKHILVAYDYDCNAILAYPLKSKTAAAHLEAVKLLHTSLNNKGVHPKLHMMDNECSELVKDYIKNALKIDLLLVPPHLHRTNAAEKAIDIFKNHFIAGLATVDPSFPLHLWCRLLPLATTTLNLMRPSRINPKLSAYELLNGIFDYNKTPLAPPGCKVIVHENRDQRGTWDPHGVPGWYLGSSNDHYRCHRVYIPKTKSERIAKTVRFSPITQHLRKWTSKMKFSWLQRNLQTF